ncbi:MAG: hypothetical protein CVV51_03370 [Spirochaetae bacterium HGW-Spirochaetae-7]|jgi:iron complex outermembrane receptor protein|nr:MAG: hypothetical protein CVV51_03370 [Spirochaetae bacterium HGW-Spirochaetae-7]
MRRIACIGALVVLTAGAFTGDAFAQGAGSQAAGGQPGELDFIVTAARTAEESDSVPAQVTVITAEDIARSGASSLVQVLERAPGVSFMPSMAGPGTESVSMRGFGENSFGRVLVLVDGVRLNNPDMKPVNWNTVALADVERIEVLDGGASVLYGNNAVSGVINIITKKGSAGTRTTISGSVGSFQTNVQRFSHQRSFGSGDLSIAVEHVGTAGYRERQAAQSVNASARATVNLSDTLGVSAQASLADLGYQLPGGLTKAQFEADPTQAVNRADEGTECNYSGGLVLEWFPGDAFQIELPLSYIHRTIAADVKSWGSYSDRAVQTAEARPKLTAGFSAGGVPIRLVGGVDLYGAWLAEYVYSDEQRTTESNRFSVAELGAGPYLSAKAELLPSLSATAGLRYDTALIAAVNMDKSVDDEIAHSAFVYDAGLSYRPLDGLKLYAKFGTLFRYPFTDEQAQTSGYADKFNMDLRPETGFNAEGGVRIDLAKQLSLNGNIFYMQLRDEIAYDDATSSNENLDQTRRIGSTASLNALFLDLVELSAGYSFVDAVLTAGANDGKHIPLVPAHSVDGTVDLILPAGMSIGTTVGYRSEMYQGGDYSNAQYNVPSYLVYGAHARWVLESSGQKLSVQVTARNLLDTAYAPLMYYSSWTSTSSYYPAEGRSVSVSVDYRY